MVPSYTTALGFCLTGCDSSLSLLLFLIAPCSPRISGDVRNGFEEDTALAVSCGGPPLPPALSRATPPRSAQSPSWSLCPSDIIQQPVPPYRRQGDGNP